MATFIESDYTTSIDGKPGYIANAMMIATKASFDFDFSQILDDEDTIQKREQLDSGKLISRAIDSEEKEEKRGIYKPKTINRKVIN